MSILMLIVLGVSQAPPVGEITTGEQLVSIVNALHSEIKDVKFIYEGENEFVIQNEAKRQELKKFGTTFQGSYAYRSDGSTLLDFYRKGNTSDSAFLHFKGMLFEGKYTQYWRYPDLSSKATKPIVTKGGPGVLDFPASYERFELLWFFRSLVGQENLVRVIGHEVINGHDTLLVETTAAGKTNKMWIDLRRGGHVLQVMQYDKDFMYCRRKDIQLAQFDTVDKKKVWFPVRGVVEMFEWSGKKFTEPVSRETTYLVRGTLVINEGLPNSKFRILDDPSDGREDGRSLGREFVAAETVIKAPPSRTDPAGVQKQLDLELGHANQQEKLLEVPSEANRWTSAATLLQLFFGIVGLALLIFAIYAIRSSRQR